MATRAITVTNLKTRLPAKIVVWDAILSGDTGTPLEAVDYPDKTIQVEGTFDGATLPMQGSNDGTNWRPLTDGQGNAIAFTGGGIELPAENPRYIRPGAPTSATGNTALVVTVVMVSAGR